MKAHNLAAAHLPGKNLILSILRSLVGALLVALFYFGLGWLLASRELGWGLALWSLIIGPFVVPLALWLYLRVIARIARPFAFAREARLAHEYFRGILHHPGPRPRLWLLPTRSLVFFWFENPFQKTSAQEVFVSERWLAQSDDLKVHDWRELWARMNQSPKAFRLLRTWQMMLWMGALSPLEAAVAVLNFVLKTLGLFTVEDLGFVLQKFLWALKVFWFQENPDAGLVWSPSLLNKKELIRRPSVLASTLWGPWCQLPERQIHPLWRVLTHSNIVLEVDSEPSPN